MGCKNWSLDLRHLALRAPTGSSAPEIKPANLLLDEDGHVWVADFGLAKTTEQLEVTCTGHVLGTPQYMPPESSSGSYDVPSVVYTVSLTLYALLIGRAVIQGRSVVEAIRNAEPGIHTSLRKLNPKAPRDLTTVILKSLTLDHTSRYQTAGDFGDDLDRLLSGHPILARGAGPRVRLVRWSRHEPAIAGMTVSTFPLLLPLAGVYAIGHYRMSDSLAIARVAEASARDSLAERTLALHQGETQRTRLGENLRLALNAI